MIKRTIIRECQPTKLVSIIESHPVHTEKCDKKEKKKPLKNEARKKKVERERIKKIFI
jgi:hypothetical protein